MYQSTSSANEHAVQGEAHLLGAGLGAGLALGLSSSQGSTLDGGLIACTDVVGVLHTGAHTHTQVVARGHLLLLLLHGSGRSHEHPVKEPNVAHGVNVTMGYMP